MTASALEGATQWFQTFVDQWKSGRKAEVEFHCESGHLQVRMHADLGQWKASTGSFCPKVWDNGGPHLPKVSPSRIRRREKRAAAVAAKEAAEENVAAEQAAVESAAAEKAATESVDAAERAAEKANAEYATAEKVAEENAAAEKAATESAIAKKAAESAATVPGSDISDQIASTSSRGSEILCCWNCSEEMTPGVKCGNCEEPMSSTHQCCAGLNQLQPALSSQCVNAKGKSRQLNMMKSCDNCDSLFCAKTGCQSCVVSPPPLLKTKTPGPSAPEKVKCCVCTALGREISLVDCGSRCPSCGITATSN